LKYFVLFTIKNLNILLIFTIISSWMKVLEVKELLEGWFLWFIMFWVVFLITMMAIGGFFMFRKFLKRLPKNDGMSELDWQEHYIKQTVHLWPEDQKRLLEELVAPVPELFRDVAREKIAGKIGELAIKEKASKITQDLVIRGYIIATPKRDYKFLIKTLKRKKIDLSPYQSLLS
jgi:hypothetical protein